MTIEHPRGRSGSWAAIQPLGEILSDDDGEAVHVSIKRRDVPTVCLGHAMRVPEDSLLGWFYDHLFNGMRPSPNRY